VCAVLALAACEAPMSTLQAAGPSARAIGLVWWWMFGVAMIVWLAVMLIWLSAMRRNRPLEGDAERRVAHRWMIGGGIVLPLVAVVALLVFGTPAGFHQLPWPTAGPAPLRIDTTGRQWWWQVRYPDAGVQLRNELRIPVGRPVDIHIGSDDVIHSFWVPRLAGKLDAIPGRINVMRLQADAPGSYRSQCAEFCGLAHAHMVMTVHAMEPAAFDAWLAQAGARQ
jgi:cytochrome c oxidase subunit II